MRKTFSRFVSDYGMLFVLLLLCGYFSWATEAEQSPEGVRRAGKWRQRFLARRGRGQGF